MKLISVIALFIAIVLVGCSSSTDEPPNNSVEGSWLIANDSDTGGLGLTFRKDGTYTYLLLKLTSNSTAQVQGENGTYAVESNTMHLTITQSTCVGVLKVSAEPETAVFKLENDTLSLANTSTVLLFHRNESEPTSNIAAQLGCFTENKFTPSSMQSVN